MTDTFASRVAAGIAAITMAAGLAAAPAFAEGGRGNSQAAHEDAPGQAKKDEAGQENPGNGNGNPPAHAGGPAAQTPPPGQAKPQGQPARPQHSARPAKRPAPAARPAKPAKPAHPVHPAKPAKPAKPARPAHGPAKAANPHAKAGKTTICHSTGSATNPYVTITISDNALPAHARHHDGRHIIPAPAGGCPQDAAAGGATSQSHRGSVAAGRAGLAAKAAAPAAGEVLPFVRSATAGETPAGAVLGVVAEGGKPLPQIRGSIEQARATKVQRREAGSRTAARSGSEQLPFTGLEAVLVALFGALLMLVGTLMRHLTRVPGATA